ncbi:MAG: tetratricopeptide repeat protein [Sandaracinaceae bacterium]
MTDENNSELTPAMDQLSAHLDRGWDLVSRGDFAGAMLSAEKSLELDEGSPEAHHLLGYIYQAQGRAEEALDQYRAAIDLDEGFVDAMLHAADVLVHPMNDPAQALELVREALDWLEDDEQDLRADAMLLEVDIHLMRQDIPSAQRVVRMLPAGPFDNPAIALQVGRARMDVGDLDGAEPLIVAAVDAQPDSSDAHYYYALLREARSDAQGALLAFLRSRNLDMDTPPPPWTLPPAQFETRVRAALASLTPTLTGPIEGALVVGTLLPGAEVVADGVDPRQPVLLDALSEPDTPPKVGRIFVYQRNIERLAAGLFHLDAEIARALENELRATFPALSDHGAAEPAPTVDPGANE